MVHRAVVCGVFLSLTGGINLPAQEVRDSPGPLEQQAKPVTPENPLPRRLASKPVEYPPEMRQTGGRGLVSLQVTLDADGKVAEIRSVRAQLVQAPGPINQAAEQRTTDALVKSAIAAAREWSFAAPTVPPLTFPAAFVFTDGTVDVMLAPPASARGRGVGASPPAPWAAAEGAMRVGGGIAPPQKTKDARPTYPLDAQEARVQGVVILEIVIGPNGKVRDARILRSVPMLDQAALTAVRKWEFRPTLVNGVAVPVVMTSTLTFTLR